IVSSLVILGRPWGGITYLGAVGSSFGPWKSFKTPVRKSDQAYNGVMTQYTVPGLSDVDSNKLSAELQARLSDYNDLHLILKHAHWNVVGPNSIAVHEMLGPPIELDRSYGDGDSERVSTLGFEPLGTPKAQAEDRTPLKYDLNRASTQDHLAAIDELYTTVIENVRESLKVAGDIDPITEDIFIAQSAELEKFQWFVRAHLDNA